MQSWISSIWIYEVLGKGEYDQDMVYKTLKVLMKVKHENKYQQVNKTPALKCIRKLWLNAKLKVEERQKQCICFLKKQN